MDQKSENDNFEEGEIAESSPTFPEFSDQLSSGKNLPLSSRLAGGQTPKQNRPDSRYPDARNANPMLMGSLPTSRPPQPPVPPVIRSTSREQLHHGYNNSQDRYDGPAPIYRDNRGSGGYSERDSLGGGDWVDPRSEYGWSEPSYGPHGVDDWSGPPRDYHDSRDAGGYYDQAPRGPHLQQRYPPIARGSSTGALNSYDQQASLDHRGNPNARGYGSGGPGYSGSSSGHPAGDYPSAYPPSGPVQLGRPHSDSRDGSFYDVATGPGSAPAITPRDYKKDLAPPSYEKNPFLNSGGAAAAAKGSLRPAPGAGSHSPPKLKRASSDGDVPTNSSSSGPPLPVYNASNKPLPPNIGKTSAPASQAPVKVPIPGSTLHTTMQTAQTAAVKPPPPPPMRPNVNNPNAPAPPQLKTSQSSGNLSNQPTSSLPTSDQQVKSSQQPPPPAPKPPSRPLAPAVDSSASSNNSSSSGAGQQARPSNHHKIPPPPEPVPPPATLFDTLMKFGQGGSSSAGGGVSGTGVGGNRPLIKVVTGSDAVVNPEHSKVFNSTAPINITAGALAAAATSAGAGGSSGNSSNLEKHLAVGTSSFAYESSLSGTTPKPISLGAAALDKIGLQPRSSSISSASGSQNDLVSFSFMSNSVSNSSSNVNSNSSAALSALDPSISLTATPGGAKSLSVSETPKASGIAETLMTPTSTALGGSAVRRPRAAWGSGLIRQTSTSSVVDAVIVPETPAAVTAPDATAAESTATAVAADTTPSAAKPTAGDSKTPAASEVKEEAKLEPRVEPKVERVVENVNVKPEATTSTTTAVDKTGKPSSASSSVNKDVKVVPPPSGPLSRVNSAQDVNAAPSAPSSKGPQQTPSQIARKNLQQEKLAAAQQAEQKATQLAAQKQQEVQRLEQRKKEKGSASQTDGLAAGGASSKKELKETKQEEEEEMDFDAAAPVAAVPAAPLTLVTPKNTPKTTTKKTVKPATPIATPVAVPAVVVATETKMETTKLEVKVESKPIKKAALPVAAKSESDGSEDSGNDSDGSTESASAKLQPPVKKVKTETSAPVSTAASSSGAPSTTATTKEQDQSSLQQAKKRKRDSAAGASGESAGEEGENGAGGESDVEQDIVATTGTTSPRKVIRFTPTAGENKTEPTDSAADSAAATSPRKRPNNNKVAVALEISAADREALSVITGRGLPRPDLLPGSKKRGRPFAANSKRNPALRDTDDDTAAADGDGEGNDSRPDSDAVSANAEQAAAQRKKERARMSDKTDKTDKQFGRGRPSTSSQYPTGSGSVKDNERLTAAQMVQQLLAAPPAKLNNKEKKALKERFMLGNLFSKETDVQRACHAIFCMNQLLKGTENNAGGGTGVTATASTGASNSSSSAGAKDTKDGANAPNPHPNYPFMTQDFSSIHSAHKVFIPTAAEISTFIDFLDGSSDMLYMYMKGIREKQYMSEAVRKDQHTAEQAAATVDGDKKVCASDVDSTDVSVAEKATDVESATATTTADCGDVTSSAASTDEKVSEKATPASESDAPAAAPEGPKIKHNANPPNLLELQHNNQLRIVEAHLFATIINNVSSVVNNNAPTFVAPYAATSSKVTTSGTAPVASGSSNSSTSGNGNKSSNSKDSNSSGNKSSRKGSSTPAATAAESTPPASTPIVSITDAVNQYMHNSIPVVYFDPQDLPQYTHNVKKMERNRESITREIRARKLHKRRAWEYLGDKYLDIHHKWDTHMTDVEKEEEAAATRDGPKLRNAVNTLSMRPFTEVNKNTSLPSLFSLSNGAAGAAGAGAGVIGRPGALSGATGATNTPGVVSIGGLTASFTNNQLNITSMNGSIANNSLFSNATTGANTSFNSRATGLGIARTDYEQEQLLQTLFASEIRQMKINNGLCEIPDMLSPWPYADNYKPPAMPKWNKNIREFVTGGKNANKDSASGAGVGDNKASKAAAKKSVSGGAAEGDSTEVKTEGVAQKAEVKVENKNVENKTVAVPAPRTQNSVAPDAPFPTFKHCYTEYFDTNGSRLTTDGKRQLCCNIPLHNSCPMNCNCALQVDRLAKFERIWTDIEKCIFIDKFMQFPKNFQKIASFLTNRTTKDCIKFYYDSKHTVEYKALLKEFDSRRKTNNKFSWVQTVKAAQYVGAAVYPSSNDNIADPSSKNSIIELPIDDLICSSFTNQPANIARLFNIPIPKLYSIHTPVQLATEQQLHTMATTNIGTGKTTLLRNNSTDGDNNNSNNSNSNDNQQNAAQNYFHNGITMPQAIASRSQITQPYPRQSTINTAKRLYSATHNGANLDDVIASALQQETNDTSDNETDVPPAATQAAAPTPKETTRRKNKNKRQSSGGNQNNNNNSSSSSSASFLPQYFNNGMLSKFPLGPDYSYIVHNERIINEAVIPSHFYGVAEHTAGESSNKQSDAVQRTYYHNAQLYSDFVSAAYNNNYASNGSNNSGNSSSSSSVNRLYDDVTSHTQAASLPNIPSVNVLNNTNRLPSAKKASTPRNPANKTSRVVKGPAPSGMPLPTTASGGSSASGGALINVPRFTPAANSAANAAGAGSADGRVSGIAMMKPQTNSVVDANGNVVSRPAVLPVRRDLIAGRGNRGARRTGLASDRVVGASNAATSGSFNSTAVVAQSGKETAKNVPASTANVTAAVTTASAAKSAESAKAAEKPTTEEMDVETPSDSAATKTAAHGDTEAADANSEIVVYAEESGTESEQEEGEGEDEEESGSDGDNNDNDGEGDNADGDEQQSEDEDDAEADPTEQQQQEQQEEQQEDEESESEVDEDGRPDLSNISRRLASDSESGNSSAGEEEEEGDDDGDDGEEEQGPQPKPQRGVDAAADVKPTAEQLDAADVMAEVVAAPTTASSNTGDDDEGMETGHSDHENEFPSEDVAFEGAAIEAVDQTVTKPVELLVSEVVVTATESITPDSNAKVASTAVPTHASAVAAAEEDSTEMLVDLDL